MSLYFGNPSRTGFLFRVVLPFFAAAIALNLAAAGLLYWSTAKTDGNAIARQRALVELVVSKLRASIAHDQESVTVWDDAVKGVQSGNQEWLDLNLGGWMKTYFGHDAAYIINPADQPIYASVDGAKREPSSLANIWTATSPLVNDLRNRLRRGDKAGTSDRVLTIGASDIVAVLAAPQS